MRRHMSEPDLPNVTVRPGSQLEPAQLEFARLLGELLAKQWENEQSRPSGNLITTARNRLNLSDALHCKQSLSRKSVD